MMKLILNASFVYALPAMAFGVFCRAFTKFSGFGGNTVLLVIHTHYFLLGMVIFTSFALFEKAYSFSEWKH